MKILICKDTIYIEIWILDFKSLMIIKTYYGPIF
jgi:hypothetical protein